MRVTVRTAHAGDVDAIVEFGAAVVPQHYATIIGQQAAQEQLSWWTPARTASAVEAGRMHVAIAKERDIVGVCETGEVDGKQVIWKLYLAPEYRGRSLGVELLGHAISSMPEHAEHVEVEHFAGNTSAAKFYEREGFEVIRTDPAGSDRSPGSAIVWRRLELP